MVLHIGKMKEKARLLLAGPSVAKYTKQWTALLGA